MYFLLDIYLINLPSAMHKPVPASQIILNGDSAGGNLVIALLQVVCDAVLSEPIPGIKGNKLPVPAGGILVSHWCSLIHGSQGSLRMLPPCVHLSYFSHDAFCVISGYHSSSWT